jgi:periplasmic protein TonB
LHINLPEKSFSCFMENVLRAHLYRNVYPMNTNNIYAEDFLDILFEGRNKDYGAYDLRRSQDRRVRNAIIGTASIALVIIGGYVLSNNLVAASMPKSEYKAIPATPTILPPAEKPITPPPPPPPPSNPPPARSSIAFNTPKISPDDVTEVPPIDSIGNKTISTVTSNGDDVNGIDPSLITGNGPANTVVDLPPAPVDHSTVFPYVEIMPSFPGGEEALAKFLKNNVRYPNMAVEAGIEGRVFVNFVVDWEGNIKDVKTVGAMKGAGLEEEAMRVVKKMPKWKPGRQNGQSVSVQFNLPIGFQLQ